VEEDALLVRREMCREALVDDRLGIDFTELNSAPDLVDGGPHIGKRRWTDDHFLVRAGQMTFRYPGSRRNGQSTLDILGPP